MTIVDGGCDTTVCGSTWYITHTTERRVNVEGFSADLCKNNVPIVTAVTVIDFPDHSLLIRVNEAISLPENAHSLLSFVFVLKHLFNVLSLYSLREYKTQTTPICLLFFVC